MSEVNNELSTPNKNTLKIAVMAFNAIPKIMEVDKEIVKFILKRAGKNTVPLGLDGLEAKNNIIGTINPKQNTITISIHVPELVWEYIDQLYIDYDVDEFNMLHFKLKHKGLLEDNVEEESTDEEVTQEDSNNIEEDDEDEITYG